MVSVRIPAHIVPDGCPRAAYPFSGPAQNQPRVYKQSPDRQKAAGFHGNHHINIQIGKMISDGIDGICQRTPVFQ